MSSSWQSTTRAVAGARQPEQYWRLHDLLRLWRLTVVAFSDPGYETRRQVVEEAVCTGRRGTPIEEIVPDWDERVALPGAGECTGELPARVRG